MPNVSLSEYNEHESEVIALKDANTRLAQQLAQAKRKTDTLVEAVHQAVYDAVLALGKPKPIPAPKADRRKGAEATLWHLTDWQGAKVTPSYNSEVMRERVLRYCQKAARITEIQRARSSRQTLHHRFRW